MTPSRALRTTGVSVFTTMFGAAGMAHDATGLGAFWTCAEHNNSATAITKLQGLSNRCYTRSPEICWPSTGEKQARLCNTQTLCIFHVLANS